MKGFNKIILMGNLTKDVDIRTTPNGQSVANFTLAVSRTWKDGAGNPQEQTSFIPCVAWGKTVEVLAKYVSKGSPILVSGRLDQRTYDDKDGNKRSVFEVSVEDFNFISSNNPNDRTPMTQAQALNGGRDFVPSDIDDAPIPLDEIPFN